MSKRVARPAVIIAALAAPRGCVRQSEVVRPPIVRAQSTPAPIDATVAAPDRPAITDSAAVHSDAVASERDDASDDARSPAFETVDMLALAAAGQPSRQLAIAWLNRHQATSSLRGAVYELHRPRELLGEWYERDADTCTTMRVSANPDRTLRLELDGALDGAPARVSYGLAISAYTGPRQITLSNGEGLTLLSREQQLVEEQPLSARHFLIGHSLSVMLSGPTITRLQPPPDGGRYVSNRSMRCLDVLEAISYDRRTLRMVRGPARIVSYRDAPIITWFRDRAECLSAESTGASSKQCGSP